MYVDLCLYGFYSFNFTWITEKAVMKRLVSILLSLCITTISGWAHSPAKILNVYNWANYIPKQVIQKFEKETGIKVYYSTYDSNELLYTKIKTDPQIGYDIIVPSGFIVQRMREEGLLTKLDKSKVPNRVNLNPLLLNQSFDPHNDFSFPYLWGTTGILINTKYYSDNEIRTWKALWNPKYKDQLTLLDSMRDVMSVALKVLGYSINDQNPDHIKAAYEISKKLIPNIQAC